MSNIITNDTSYNQMIALISRINKIIKFLITGDSASNHIKEQAQKAFDENLKLFDLILIELEERGNYRNFFRNRKEKKDRQEKDTELRRCAFCQEPITKRSNKTYCSDSCRSKASMRKRIRINGRFVKE